MNPYTMFEMFGLFTNDVSDIVISDIKQTDVMGNNEDAKSLNSHDATPTVNQSAEKDKGKLFDASNQLIRVEKLEV